MRVLEPRALDELMALLRAGGYTVVGPTVHDGAIVYDELASTEDLPRGWVDRQAAGSYRLERRADGAWFGYNLGPHSWKKYLFPPSLRLFRAERGPGRKVRLRAEEPPEVRYAFFGVRPCELRALAVQDRVFLGGLYVDPLYRARRAGAFVVAVQCGQAGDTCFCASWGTGPRVGDGEAGGYDLVLTELLEDGRHGFLAGAGSPRGEELLAALPGCEAGPDDLAAAERALARAEAGMGRSLATEGLRELFARNLESRRWDQIAERCLACGNCTQVCPTCFCSTVEDTTDLAGTAAERHRRWDSCFTVDFSYLHGGSVRTSIGARYRQWITHKLSTWHDQFGTSGCVGCGRCITWCPVGIDLTEETRALRASEP
jgi:sulfhydrogenase subunit beta (sulfur reductase)